MNIHLLPHKMANHNILATELLVEVTNMKKAPPMMHLGLVKDFWRFGVHSAILKSSLLNGIDGMEGLMVTPLHFPRRQIR